MIFDFLRQSATVTMPAGGSFVVTPSDAIGAGGFANNAIVRCITINVSGTVSWRDSTGAVQTTGILPVGNYPMLTTGIMATGTTATGITAWY